MHYRGTKTKESARALFLNRNKDLMRKPPKRKKTAKKYTIDGLCMSIPEWGEFLGINPGVIYNRKNKFKWSIEQAICTPVRRK